MNFLVFFECYSPTAGYREFRFPVTGVTGAVSALTTVSEREPARSLVARGWDVRKVRTEVSNEPDPDPVTDTLDDILAMNFWDDGYQKFKRAEAFIRSPDTSIEDAWRAHAHLVENNTGEKPVREEFDLSWYFRT